MLKIILSAVVIAFAAAASANDGQTPARYHTMSGRTLVWHAPQLEKPAYALTGQEAEARDTAHKPRLEIRQHGRAGNTVEPSRDNR